MISAKGLVSNLIMGDLLADEEYEELKRLLEKDITHCCPFVKRIFSIEESGAPLVIFPFFKLRLKQTPPEGGGGPAPGRAAL